MKYLRLPEVVRAIQVIGEPSEQICREWGVAVFRDIPSFDPAERAVPHHNVYWQVVQRDPLDEKSGRALQVPQGWWIVLDSHEEVEIYSEALFRERFGAISLDPTSQQFIVTPTP